MRSKAVSLTNWKRYLDYKNNPKLIPFIKSRGVDVFWQVAQNVHKYHITKQPSLTMVIHENAPYAISIPYKEYFEVMEYSLSFFESIEDYGKCKQIYDWIQLMKSKKRTIKKEVKKLI